MVSPNYEALSAPYSDVHVQIDADSDTFYLIYTGMPDVLLAAGAVEVRMIQGARTCGSGRDSFGNRYRRSLSGKSGRIKVLRYVQSSRNLRAFPGFVDTWIPAPIAWLELNPGKLHESNEIIGKDELQTLIGAKETFIAANLVDAQTIENLYHHTDVPSTEGYYIGQLSRYLDGLYQIQRIKCEPKRQKTFKDHARTNRALP